MKSESPRAPVASAASEAPASDEAKRSRLSRRLVLALATTVVLFVWPLYLLINLAFDDDLYSHVIIVPLVSGFIAWRTRRSWLKDGAPNRKFAAIAWGAAGLLVALSLILPFGPFIRADAVSFTTLAFVFAVAGTLLWFVPTADMHHVGFPLGFLIFLVPFPQFLVDRFEGWLQVGSAEPAFAFFRLVGTPVLRNEMFFQLPGITLQIAPECSGIRSTLVLVITSVVAAWLLLRSRWARVALVAAAIPIALIRNGFRVFIIGELCVRVGPHMIDSFIHRHGGPIFFALSLIPFSALLFLLMRLEARPEHSSSQPPR